MADATGPVRGRLAPSPTGRLHLGNAFAFLAAWLSVRQQGGALVLRMEDIDPDRSRPDFATAILEDLAWLGLDWDEGPDKGGVCAPYEQSRRLGRYAILLDDLERRGLTYPCFCTRKDLRLLASAPHIGDEGVPYPGTCRLVSRERRHELETLGRRACVRLDIAAALRSLGGAGEAATGEASVVDAAVEDAPAGNLAFTDGVLGPQSFSPQRCGGDFALRRSDGVVAYQLAVAADDAAMDISEVLRGDDLVLSTPRQLLLFALMGRKPPRYAHLPLLHDASGERLAKRHKALELAFLREQGISPRAVTGWLAYLAGWQQRPEAAAPGELVRAFSLAGLRGRFLRLPPDITEHLRAL